MSIQVTKHIAIHIHHLRDLIEKQFVDLVYISTKIQLADVFTEALPNQAFAIHLDTLFGIPPTAHSKEYLRVIKLQRQSGFVIPMYKDDTADMHEQLLISQMAFYMGLVSKNLTQRQCKIPLIFTAIRNYNIF